MFKFKTKACRNCGYAIVQQSNIWNGRPDKSDPNLLLERCPFCNAPFYFEEEIEDLFDCQTILDKKVYAKYIYGNPEKEQLYQARTQKELEEIREQLEEKPFINFMNDEEKRQEANLPKCPTCSSTNIEKISSFDKAAGAVMFGLFSKTARSQFKCRNCGYKW